MDRNERAVLLHHERAGLCAGTERFLVSDLHGIVGFHGLTRKKGDLTAVFTAEDAQLRTALRAPGVQ